METKPLNEWLASRQPDVTPDGVRKALAGFGSMPLNKYLSNGSLGIDAYWLFWDLQPDVGKPAGYKADMAETLACFVKAVRGGRWAVAAEAAAQLTEIGRLAKTC